MLAYNRNRSKGSYHAVYLYQSANYPTPTCTMQTHPHTHVTLYCYNNVIRLYTYARFVPLI